MEVIKPYIGSYMDSSVFLNNGKYGYNLNHNNKLYGVPKWFEKPTLNQTIQLKLLNSKRK